MHFVWKSIWKVSYKYVKSQMSAYALEEFNKKIDFLAFF